ncbi:hypothetical protein PTSG_10187 [Salpingoeca rosetta]|uniref:Uncharacterized protein n=1 Tax=Salpingoeca rosetta (strain ATCC 50818 / BSB-021) TaxID=946362 RepID=F2UQJ9_SALR5|nr:uncharacterized protein PTSG_10187 [Salpingoeca rosetta]EGD79904.1 hypothetical protein PTSG_10187 [Salpingoeca rosetta]|eukprot:XP_004988525.1 hypothetical protein PTSG_10187 [Salpingoeca rosetta]
MSPAPYVDCHQLLIIVDAPCREAAERTLTDESIDCPHIETLANGAVRLEFISAHTALMAYDAFRRYHVRSHASPRLQSFVSQRGAAEHDQRSPRDEFQLLDPYHGFIVLVDVPPKGLEKFTDTVNALNGMVLGRGSDGLMYVAFATRDAADAVMQDLNAAQPINGHHFEAEPYMERGCFSRIEDGITDEEEQRWPQSSPAQQARETQGIQQEADTHEGTAPHAPTQLPPTLQPNAVPAPAQRTRSGGPPITGAGKPQHHQQEQQQHQQLQQLQPHQLLQPQPQGRRDGGPEQQGLPPQSQVWGQAAHGGGKQ